MGKVSSNETSCLAVLDLFRRHKPNWVSVEALRIALELSVDTIHIQIAELRQMGHEIEGVPARGFRLLGHPKTLRSELIEYGLGTDRIGKQVLVYENTDSTNDVAWHYAAETGYDGLSVFAEQQRAGRGRLGRTWSAGKGSSILVSVLLQNEPQIRAAALTLLAGLATAMTLEKQIEQRVGVKWPNDVTIGGRKVAGTIVESRQIATGHTFVIGIGINCQQREQDFPEDLRETAISLRQVTGREIDRLNLAQDLLRQLDHWITIVNTEGIQVLHQEWSARCDDIGRRITVGCNRQNYCGRVMDVHPEKGLLLQLDSGPIKIFDGATTTVIQRG
jgi:BirA family transcriptional regulator, biotin operon repressor / biotin---[acetyl-CoA-carboxylase] ligase